MDLKIIPKGISEILKKLQPGLTSLQPLRYIKNRHIGKNWRLISDLTEIAKLKEIGKVFQLKMDNGKSFDSLNHTFLIFTQEKYGFGESFIL